MYLWVALMPLSAIAQDSLNTVSEAAVHTLRFGYYSPQTVLHALPGYAQAMSRLEALRKQYEAEQQRASDEFTKKYEEFLDGQRTFAPNIRDKRQAELEDLIRKNTAFKQQAEDLLRKAEEDMLQPLKQRVTDTARRLATEWKLDFVLNADGDNLLYVSPASGQDLTPQLLKMLK